MLLNYASAPPTAGVGNVGSVPVPSDLGALRTCGAPPSTLGQRSRKPRQGGDVHLYWFCEG